MTLVLPITNDSPYKIARFCVRVLHQVLLDTDKTKLTTFLDTGFYRGHSQPTLEGQFITYYFFEENIQLVHELVRQIVLAKEASQKQGKISGNK